MKFIGKIISFIICFVLAIPLGIVCANTLENIETESAIAKENLDLFKTLGIVDNEFVFSHREYITKGEVAYIATALLGAENFTATKQIFIDVPVEEKYAGAIEVLADRGVISGKGDGTYGVEQYASFAEVTKIFVSILGYEVKAQHSGGYPGGYLNVASNIQLLKGVSEFNGLLTQKDFRELLENAIEVDIPLITSMTKDGADYEVTKGRTLLTEYHDIYMGRGIVTGNSFTSFDGISMLENYVTIDTFGQVDVGATNAEAYLGHSVIYFIEDYKEDTCQLLYIADEKSNQTQVIEADILCDEKTSLSALYYYNENEDLKNIRLADDVKIVYNGVFERNVTLDMLKPEMGRITVIDSNHNGQGDILIVEDVQIAVVDVVDVANEKLYLKHSNVVHTLNTDTRNVIVKNLKEEIALKYINQGDVVSIAESKDRTAISIVASNTTIAGSIDQISGDEIFINNVMYKVSHSYQALAARTDIYVPQITIGLTGTFYLDEFGDIAYVTESTSDGFLYGYLLNAYIDSSFDKTIGLQIFSQDGQQLKLQASDKLKVCGTKLTDADQIRNYLWDQGQVKRQLVTFKLNDEGKVTELWTATSTDQRIGYDLENFSHDYGQASLQHRYGALGTKYRVDGQTIVFTIPADQANYKNYSIVEAASLLDSFVYEKASIYDADENKIARVVILYDMQGGGGLDVALYQTKISIVDSVATAVDQNGELTNVLYHYTDGLKEKNIVKDPEGENIFSRYWQYSGIKVSDLQPGDIIQLRLNADKEIETFHVLYRGESAYTECSSSGVPSVDWYTGALHTAYGEVKDKISKRITVNAHSDGTDYNWNREFIINGIPVYLWDETASTKCKLGSIHDIDIGDKVFVKTVNNTVREVVVFK